MDEQVHQSDDADVLHLAYPRWTPLNGGDNALVWPRITNDNLYKQSVIVACLGAEDTEANASTS